MPLTDLPNLIARLEKAEVCDEELFRDVLIALIPRNDAFWNHFGGEFYTKFWPLLGVGAFTEAALALVERVLPGWDWTLESPGPEQLALATLHSPKEEMLEYQGEGKAAPQAILSALLRAKEAQGK